MSQGTARTVIKKKYVMGEGEGEVRKGENIRVRETAPNEKKNNARQVTPKNIHALA